MFETLQQESPSCLNITIASIKDTIGIQQRREKLQIREDGLSSLNLLHDLSMQHNAWRMNCTRLSRVQLDLHAGHHRSVS